MPHIHTKPGQHDLTASAVIIRDDMDELRVLLHMHKKHQRLLQPGGHVELDESPWQAIAHELEEETGYMLDQLDVLQPRLRIKNSDKMTVHPQPLLINTHPIGDGHFHTDIAFLFLAHEDPRRLPHEGESDDLRWLSLAEIQQVSSDMIYDDTRQITSEALQHFAKEWEPVVTSSFN